LCHSFQVLTRLDNVPPHAAVKNNTCNCETFLYYIREPIDCYHDELSVISIRVQSLGFPLLFNSIIFISLIITVEIIKSLNKLFGHLRAPHPLVVTKISHASASTLLIIGFESFRNKFTLLSLSMSILSAINVHSNFFYSNCSKSLLIGSV
jgi:hypothetical protein